ncbi:MAG: 3-deoxy-7-phosphoheptulonate synthase [Candidatus Hydrogenedentes bacterium]|nr:3-deoxy-7-phosphoheptulonate synthase [Candidatus Hydrogenedentota bacterium]
MIIVMASRKLEDIQHVVDKVKELGYIPHVIEGVEKTVIACVGEERGKESLVALQALPHVEKVLPILKPFKLASREVKQEKTVVKVGSVAIGSDLFCVIAGPCAVESREQIMQTAEFVKGSGAHILRGGAYKPRTSPYSFQGLEIKGLELLKEAGEKYGIPVITEAVTVEQVPVVADYADIIQIGARNMQNFGLLRAVGKLNKPVLLKRGMMSTINEWLMSAEYIMSGGNQNVILCERGIRTFEPETRNTLDIQAVPIINKYSHLPVVVDPSHASGVWDLVIPMSRAVVASGADGIMVEVHPNPEEALSDGAQSLKFSKFELLMREIKPIVEVLGRRL